MIQRSIALIMLLTLASGCVSYRHEIVAPESLAGEIGDSPLVTRVDPVRIEWRTLDNRLIVQIFNDTDTPVRLRGDRSAIVEPTGQSMSMRPQSIPPASFAKLILPPRLLVESDDPQVGMFGGTGTRGTGVGMGVGFGSRSSRYVDAWNWKPDQQIRLELVFEQDEALTTHMFTVVRRRN